MIGLMEVLLNGKYTCFSKEELSIYHTWNWNDPKYSGTRHFSRFRLSLWQRLASCQFYDIWRNDASSLYIFNPSSCIRPGRANNFFEIMDHTSIYFFIAGTYTPFLFLAVDGWVGWTLFGIVWGLAIGGTVFKSFFVKKFLFTSTMLYVVMGWLIVFVWKDLAVNLHPSSLVLLIIGGMCYTVGAIFYMWKLFKHHHAVWHVFVLSGTVCHFFAVLYLLP